jgi:hypothetical protein
LLWKLDKLATDWPHAIAAGPYVLIQSRFHWKSDHLAWVEPATGKAKYIVEPPNDGSAIIDLVTDHEQRLYTLSSYGTVTCRDLHGPSKTWWEVKLGSSKLPLTAGSHGLVLDGHRLIVNLRAFPSLVALDAKSGAELWRKDYDLAVRHPVVAGLGGRRQVIFVLAGSPNALAGADLATGNPLWKHELRLGGFGDLPPLLARNQIIALGPEGTLGCTLDRDGGVDLGGDVDAANLKFRGGRTHMAMLGDHVFFGSAAPVCMNVYTLSYSGWNTPSTPTRGAATITVADDHVYFWWTSKNELSLAEANPKTYQRKSRFALPEDFVAAASTPVPAPLVHQGRLYLRGADQLLCYYVRAPAPK